MQTPVIKNSSSRPPQLLEKGEMAYETINPAGSSPTILVCEHASNHIPKFFDELGLSEDVRQSHIAWDPGARDLSIALSNMFDAPLVCSKISRLVYDCNRPIDAPSAMPAESEIYNISRNENISPTEARARFEQIYQPFSKVLDALILEKKSSAIQPILITIHSFTPVYFGQRREVEIGILHSEDSRLADPMLEEAKEIKNIRIERNQPYGPEDGVDHTLEIHGKKHGIPNVMIEVRNDLLADSAGIETVAAILARLIKSGFANADFATVNSPNARDA